MRYLLALAAAATLATGAQAVTLVNGSFETGVAIPGSGLVTLATGDTTSLPGWRVLSQGIEYADTNAWDASNGSRSIELSAATAGGVVQRVTDFEAGALYRVRFDVSANPAGPDANYRVLVSSTGGTATIFNYGQTAANSPTNMLYQTFEYFFRAGSANGNLQFRSLGSSQYGPVLDNVSISLVPEPASWMLLIAGFGMTGFALRRRRVTSVAA